MLTKIVDWIIGQKVISPTQRELYEYAVQCFFVTAIPFVISVLLSILLHMLAACVCFTLAFMLIRKFGGGISREAYLGMYDQFQCGYGDRQLSGAMGGDTICCADTYDRSSGGRNLDK